MRGRGDGSFEEGSPVDLGPTLPSYFLGGLLDADGDGTREWVVKPSEGSTWVAPLDLSQEGLTPLVELDGPGVGRITKFVAAVGDINADGADDYIASSDTLGDGMLGQIYLMLSVP